MEIYVNYLAIEVTRRCNMKCNHCLRGDAQNLDISTAVLSGIAKHIHPASVIFTGGEPSLNVPAIKRYFELAERYDTMPAAFYVATNGATSKEQMRDLALTLLESYAMEVKWSPRSRTNVDMETLKIRFPDAYNQCVSVNPESSRVFSIKRKKVRTRKK